MPRMWMVPVETLCDKHLVAEHHETHVFAGRIHKGMPLQGWLDGNYLEPLSLQSRHDRLVEEMLTSGLNHRSPLDLDLSGLPEHQLQRRIDKVAAESELRHRCSDCRARAK